MSHQLPAMLAFYRDVLGLNVKFATATNAAFGEAAAKVVKTWRFKPGKIDGKPVRVAIMQKTEFTIDD